MRGAWLVAVLLVAGVYAQAPEVELVTLEIEPFAETLQPLAGVATTRMVARASCLLVDAGQSVRLAYSVVDSPDWATVVVSPAVDAAPVDACDEGYVEREAHVSVTADASAPAFAPAPIRVRVEAGPSERSQVTEATVNASARYFPLFDATLTASIFTLAPASGTEAPISLVNYGNGPTRFEFMLESEPRNLTVILPQPVTLGSPQMGAADRSGEVKVRVASPPEEGIVNRVETVTIRVVGAYATDPSEGSEETKVSFLVTVKSGGGLEKTPAPGLALVLLAVALVAWRVRR